MTIERAWNPQQHPRAPKGSAGGGQFAPATGSQGQAKGAKDTRATPGNANPVGMGEHGKRVSDLQHRLSALGYKLDPDGVFGPKTLAAVKAYQKAHGLKVDGLVGPKTTAALRAHQPPAGGKPAGQKASRALTHEPLGKPGGPGLFHHKGLQLPAYIQHIARDLIESRGMPMSEAIATAISQCKKWAAGGGDVHPDTRAKAQAAIAEWERLKASAHAKRSEPMSGDYDSDGLDSSWDDLDDLPDLTGLTVADFTEPGDTDVSRAKPKLGSGARFKALKARLAAKGIKDPGALAAHIGRKKFGRKKFTALASAARKRKGSRMSRSELFRAYPLEDYHIVRTGDGDGTGRVVEAYMTVFDEPTEIYDHQGRYKETIDRAAFNKRISDLERSRNGFAAAKVFYNHGMTIHATPSDRYSMPVAVCEGIRSDTRGPVTRARYLDTPLGNEVLEMWRSGAITAQSFTGAIIRSDPQLRMGEKYRPRNGQLQTVRRLELGLKEFGPTPFPAYQSAELVGVRMSSVGGFAEEDADLDDIEQIDDEALPPDEEAATGEPPEVHSSRDYREHRLLVLRTAQMCRDAGIAPLKGWES